MRVLTKKNAFIKRLKTKIKVKRAFVLKLSLLLNKEYRIHGRASEFFLLVACLVLGALQVLAFAPFEYWPISFLSLAAFFSLLPRLTAKQAFRAGLAYGYGVYGFGVSWVYVSLSTYGGMPLWMGVIAVLGFAGLLASFIAMASAASVYAFRGKYILMAIPFAWLVFEWMKSWVLTGFPWLDLGYTQTPTWLISWGAIGGVYLVSLMVCSIAVLIVVLVRALLRSKFWQAGVSGLAICVIVLTSYLVAKVEWSQATGEPITVGVIQANVPINDKWQSEVRAQLIGNYKRLSHQLAQSHKVDLLVLPETAFPLYAQQTDDEFWRKLTPPNTALLAGIMDSPSIAQGSLDESYNAAVLSCDGETQIYRKRHLVPFGEYLPMRFLFDWVLDYLELPMSDFSSWQGQQSLSCGDINVGLSICYEDAFAAEYRDHVGDATVLVNISEDAWFGDSFAPHQRRQMAQMRAVELSRPMVRSANSGPSLFIDHKGRLLEASKQFVAATLVRDVQPHTGDTPFKRFGNLTILLSLLSLIALGVASRRKMSV